MIINTKTLMVVVVAAVVLSDDAASMNFAPNMEAPVPGKNYHRLPTANGTAILPQKTCGPNHNTTYKWIRNYSPVKLVQKVVDANKATHSWHRGFIYRCVTCHYDDSVNS